MLGCRSFRRMRGLCPRSAGGVIRASRRIFVATGEKWKRPVVRSVVTAQLLTRIATPAWCRNLRRGRGSRSAPPDLREEQDRLQDDIVSDNAIKADANSNSKAAEAAAETMRKLQTNTPK